MKEASPHMCVLQITLEPFNTGSGKYGAAEIDTAHLVALGFSRHSTS
jgi:hypothetical protein